MFLHIYGKTLVIAYIIGTKKYTFAIPECSFLVPYSE